jgi:hypothetical protein
MRNLMVGFLVLAGLSTPAFAQLTHETRVNVPFAFHVGDTQLPAGEYSINRLTDTGQVIGFRSLDFTGWSLWSKVPAANILVTNKSVYKNGMQTGLPSKVVFNKYGQDRYFVAEVWQPTGAVELNKSRRERELITSKIVASITPEIVTIAARLVP